MARTYATWNSADKGPKISLSAADLNARNTVGAQWNTVRATISHNSGKHYFEQQAVTPTRQIITGFMTSSAFLGDNLTSGFPGFDAAVDTSWGWLTINGARWYQGGSEADFLPRANNLDILRYKVDLDNKVCHVAVNNGAFDPTDLNKELFPVGVGIFPALGAILVNTGSNANFGQNAFSYSVPSGYRAGWYEEEEKGGIILHNSIERGINRGIERGTV